MFPTHTEAAVCPRFQGRHSESSPGLWLDLVVSDPCMVRAASYIWRSERWVGGFQGHTWF